VIVSEELRCTVCRSRMIGCLRFETQPNDFSILHSIPPIFPRSTSTQTLHEKGRLLNLAIFVVNLHAQLVRQYLGSLTFFFFSRLFTLTFVVLLISLPYSIPVRFFNWLYLFSTSFNRLSSHMRGACVCTFSSSGFMLPFLFFDHVALEKNGVTNRLSIALAL
jgi:hypothetical protein